MNEYFVTVQDSFYVEANSEEEAIKEVSSGGWFDIRSAEITAEIEKEETPFKGDFPIKGREEVLK